MPPERVLPKSLAFLPCGGIRPIRPIFSSHSKHLNPRLWGPRAATVVALRQANPNMVLREIGEQVGLTRERVRQILARAGLPTIGRQPARRLTFFCEVCDGSFTRPASEVASKRRRGVRVRFCSYQCLGRNLGRYGRHAKGPRQTHCKRGHSLDDAFVYYRPTLQRQCRTCHRAYCRQYQRSWVARKRALAGKE